VGEAKELQEAKEKITELEDKLKSVANDHQVLELDYNAASSELETLRAVNTEKQYEEAV